MAADDSTDPAEDVRRANHDAGGDGHDPSLRDGKRLQHDEEGYWDDSIGPDERHALLATAVSASNTMVVLADVRRDDQPLIYVNRYFCEFTGYEPEEVLGRNCRFLQFRKGERVEQGVEEPRAEINEALKNETFVRVILRNFKKNGDEFRNELFMSPVEGPNGDVQYFVGVQNDTSVRDRLVDDLKEGEASLRGVFNASPVALALLERGVTGRAKHLRVNPTAAGLLGADPVDCIGKAFADLDAPGPLAERLETALDTIDAGGGPVRFRLDATVKGEAKSYTVGVTAVEIVDRWDARRDARRYCYVVEDLTAFGEAERDRALMRAAVEHADAPTVILTAELDPPGPRFLYANPAAVRLTGYGSDTLFDRLVTKLDGEPTDPSFPARFRQSLKEKGSFRGDSVIVHENGTPATVEWSVSAVRDATGEPTSFVATLQDVADRRELERQVLEAQTREQARIARELHDGVAQQLAGLTMLCETLRRQVTDGGDATASADAIGEAVRGAAADLRAVAHGLMPLDPRRGGLTEGLRRLARTTAELTPADCRFEAADGLTVGDPAVAHHLYRIAQEAVGNAVRHGRAKTVTVALTDDGTDRAVLTVTDDGGGFDPAAVAADPEGGMGLTAMRYRAKAVGGRLAFEPAEGGGTRVVCVFPHAARDRGAAAGGGNG